MTRSALPERPTAGARRAPAFRQDPRRLGAARPGAGDRGRRAGAAKSCAAATAAAPSTQIVDELAALYTADRAVIAGDVTDMLADLVSQAAGGRLMTAPASRARSACWRN